MALNRWQAIIWTNADPIYWHIYAALGGDELTQYNNMADIGRRHFQINFLVWNLYFDLIFTEIYSWEFNVQ